MRLAVALVFLGWLIAPPTAEGTVSKADLDAYLRLKPRQGTSSAPINPVIGILDTVGRGKGVDAAVAALAERWRISSEAAEAVVDLVVVQEPWSATEAQAAGFAVRRRALTQRLVARAGESVEVWRVVLSQSGSCADPSIERQYLEHRWAADELIRSESFECDRWLLDLPRYATPTPLFYARVGGSLLFGTDRLLAKRAARDAVAPSREPLDTPQKILVTREYWLELTEQGTPALLLEEARALSEPDLAAVLADNAAADLVVDGLVLENAPYLQSRARSLQIEWVLALLATRQGAEARGWLRRWNWPPPTGAAVDPRRGPTPEQELATRRAAVRRLAEDSTDEQAFELFSDDVISRSSALRSPAAHSVVVEYLETHHYPELAAYVGDSPCWWDGSASAARWDAFPAPFQQIRAELLARLKEARQQMSSCKPPGESDEPEFRPAPRKELAVPANLRRPPVPESAREREVPRPRGLERFNVVRVSRGGDLVAAISLSTSVDPVGEAGGGGYWLHLSPDRGRTWRPPLYLGLQQNEPYVVPSTSRLPLVRGTTLQLEIEVHELDQKSITFPPVGLRTKRDARDLYIEIPLADIERDSDGDGLTDLLELKLGTNPNDPDTDHDGLPDGVDSLPQVPRSLPPIPDVEVVREALSRIFGYDGAAIRTASPGKSAPQGSLFGALPTAQKARAGDESVLFLDSDPDLFRGLSLPRRVIFVTPARTREIRQNYGVFYPVELHIWFDHAHKRAIALWNAGWAGGQLDFSKHDGVWQASESNRWIT